MARNTPFYAIVTGLLVLCLAASVAVIIFGYKGLSSPRTVFHPAGTAVTPTEGSIIVHTEVVEPPMPPIGPTETLDPTKYPALINPQETKPAPLSTPSVSVTPQPKPGSSILCNQTGKTSILAIGRDETNQVPPYGADAIRLISVDFDSQKVVIISFPRSLWLKTPSLTSKFNVSGIQLGSLYKLVADSSEKDKDIVAADALAKTLKDNFNITPDHFVTFNTSALIQLVDTLGGIEVQNSEEVWIQGYRFPAGRIALNSKMVSLYVRHAPERGDEWKRLERQNAVLEGLKSRLLTPGVLTKLPQLFEIFKSSFLTDLSLDNLTALSCAMQALGSDRVEYFNQWDALVTMQGDGTMVLNSTEEAKNKLLQTLGAPGE